ncbi:putative chromatin regulator PHD family [Lupinus albus]|uniref:Putative chromatin regulator PHD family n=1 Tax=Lupinus albus TaxID=3870 RepID=A0A6A4QHW5_LUPAL|nr:putative chromatin regulator PHD family [Lupinus albus]
MVTGWRRAFCTTIPKDNTESKVLSDKQHCDTTTTTNKDTNHSPKTSSKFGFFSNPSTPRSQSNTVTGPNLRCRTSVTTTTCSVPNSPKTQCSNPKKQNNSPKLFQFSSPKSLSPSTFSLLKANLRLSKSRCGICLQSVKSGQGTAIFTAECSHTFHFPCIATHAKKNPIVTCPVCSTCWKELPVLSIHSEKKISAEGKSNDIKTRSLKVYNDDEPLLSPTSVARFNPIPESEDEEDENTEFQGFNVFTSSPVNNRNLQVCLLPEAAIVAGNRSYESYVLVMKLKAPPVQTAANAARRTPVDLVMVLDVGGAMNGSKLRSMKHMMRMIISLLGSADRLSIVAFSAGSKRLLPLRRMTSSGQRSARRIVDALAAIDQPRGGSPVKNDAVKKAAKVLEDRRDKNSVASIIVLSGIQESRAAVITTSSNSKPYQVSSTRLSQLEIPVHSVSFPREGDCAHALTNDTFTKLMNNLLSVVAQDVKIQLSVVSRARTVEIAAVYSLSGRPEVLESGSIKIVDLYAEEERELLLELKVPAVSAGSHHVLTVLSSYVDPLSQELINPIEQAMLVPRPHTVRSSSVKIERLRNLHVTARAVAESSRLAEHADFSGARHLLSSAQALLSRSGKPCEEYLRWLEAELAELQQLLRQNQVQTQRPGINHRADEKLEPLTPTSAWRAAEKLAKVAIMKKSMNRVSDLHGFENARF